MGLTVAGLIVLFLGGANSWQALDHLKREYRDNRGMFIFWQPGRYTPAGQSLLRRALAAQLLGLALLGIAMLLP